MSFTCEPIQPFWPAVAEEDTGCMNCHHAIAEGATYVTNQGDVELCWRCYRTDPHRDLDFLAEVGYDRKLDAWITFFPEGMYTHYPTEFAARAAQNGVNDDIVLGWQDAALEAGEPNYNNETWNIYANLSYRRHLLATTCTLRRKGRAPGEAHDPTPDH